MLASHEESGVMPTWYKHHIPDWMDGTGSLDAEAYRTYHVIVQLIYQNEDVIANNEHGIAGLCKQSLKTYRTALAKLVKMGKLTLDDGRIGNARASEELQNLDEQRIKASHGGKNGAGKSKRRRKSLKTKSTDAPALLETKSIRDETRLDKTPTPTGVEKRATRLPDDWKPQQADRDEAKRVLGANAGREFQKFRDYWKAQPGQRGVKLDWDATWRNWVRKASELGNGKNQTRGGSLLDAIDEELASLDGKEETDSPVYPDHIQRIPRGSI
jgi:uncharacterized protein YdaU (DUF1376 family)